MVADPQKELRFTRSGQAVGFCIFGAVLCGMAVTLVATGYYYAAGAEFAYLVYAVPCLILAASAFCIARSLTKHAYLILTPIGLEIFPFFRPVKGMQIVFWQEIYAAEIDEQRKWLTIHYNEERTAGMHLSLSPVRKKLRDLLAKAVMGRVKV